MKPMVVAFVFALSAHLVTGCCTCPGDTGVNWTVADQGGESPREAATSTRESAATNATQATAPARRAGTGPVDQAQAAELATNHAFAEGLDVETYSDIVVTSGANSNWVVTFTKPRSRRYFIINVNRLTRATETGEIR